MGGKPSPGRKHPEQRTHPLRAFCRVLLGMATSDLAHHTEVEAATATLARGRCKECPYADNVTASYSTAISAYARCT